MKQKYGIICLETEWEHTVERNRRSIHTSPLLEFLENADQICPLRHLRRWNGDFGRWKDII